VTVAPTRRVARGRGHGYLLDGDRADGVTTVVGDGIPKRALVDWAARVTAGYAVDHWDELVEMKPSERLQTLEKARYADVKAAGLRGTDVHALALRLSAGEEVDVPEPLQGHVDAYLRFTADWQPAEILTETVVGNRRHRYMGTLDAVAHLGDGQVWLLDFKTSASGIWPEAAVQLAAYRNAEFYLDADGAEQPMPLVDTAGCVWLRADGYDLIPVNTGPDVFRIFLYAQQLAQFTRAPRETYVGDTLTHPEAS
jgi:hypothetical protein